MDGSLDPANQFCDAGSMNETLNVLRGTEPNGGFSTPLPLSDHLLPQSAPAVKRICVSWKLSRYHTMLDYLRFVSAAAQKMSSAVMSATFAKAPAATER